MPPPMLTISEIWRYPITSVGGEQLVAADLDASGLRSDRRFVLIDRVTGQAAAPEREMRWQKALHLTAASRCNGLPTIEFPNGDILVVGSPALDDRLSDYFGFPVAIAMAGPADRGSPFPPAGPRPEQFPVHVLTTASLRRLAELRNTSNIDVRRFRPTFLVSAVDEDGFAENDWIGRRLVHASVELHVEEPTKRCGFTIISQPGLEHDPEILRSILRHNGRNLGVYCSVRREGRVCVGDKIAVV